MKIDNYIWKLRNLATCMQMKILCRAKSDRAMSDQLTHNPTDRVQ